MRNLLLKLTNKIFYTNEIFNRLHKYNVNNIRTKIIDYSIYLYIFKIYEPRLYVYFNIYINTKILIFTKN